jgi:hypothetical protein
MADGQPGGKRSELSGPSANGAPAVERAVAHLGNLGYCHLPPGGVLDRCPTSYEGCWVSHRATRCGSGSPRTGEERGQGEKGIIIAGTLLFVVGTAGATPAASTRASVTIVHGLPGFTTDSYLDGELLLDGFQPTSTAGPLRVAPRSYDVDIREVGAPADSPPVLSATLPITAGSNISVVAHLTHAGDGAVTVFENTFRRLPAGRSLLRVRHVAAASVGAVRWSPREGEPAIPR